MDYNSFPYDSFSHIDYTKKRMAPRLFRLRAIFFTGLFSALFYESEDRLLHKPVIDRLNGSLEILVLDTNDDVQLGGALIDHAYIDMRVGEGGE